MDVFNRLQQEFLDTHCQRREDNSFLNKVRNRASGSNAVFILNLISFTVSIVV